MSSDQKEGNLRVSPSACGLLATASRTQRGAEQRGADRSQALTKLVCGGDNVSGHGRVQIGIQNSQGVQLCYMVPSYLRKGQRWGGKDTHKRTGEKKEGRGKKK